MLAHCWLMPLAVFSFNDAHGMRHWPNRWICVAVPPPIKMSINRLLMFQLHDLVFFFHNPFTSSSNTLWAYLGHMQSASWLHATLAAHPTSFPTKNLSTSFKYSSGSSFTCISWPLTWLTTLWAKSRSLLSDCDASWPSLLKRTRGPTGPLISLGLDVIILLIGWHQMALLNQCLGQLVRSANSGRPQSCSSTSTHIDCPPSRDGLVAVFFPWSDGKLGICSSISPPLQ